MLDGKHQEHKQALKKNVPHHEEGTGILSEEIFSTIEGYAMKGVEDEYIPDGKKPKTEILTDI